MDTGLDIQRVMPLVVIVGGQLVNAYDADTSHSVEEAIGTASIEIAKPYPSTVDINAEVTIQTGYVGDQTGVIFNGRLSDINDEYGDDGNIAQIRCQGWASLLSNPQEDDINLNYLFGQRLTDTIRLLCAMREVPKSRIDSILHYDVGASEANIRFSGNAYADDASTHIPPGTSLLGWIDQKVRLFGYRIYDTPDGTVRVSRVSGLPTGGGEQIFTEGNNLWNVSRTVDISSTVSYWRVEGAKLIDASTGVINQVQSIPASVPYNADLDPPGYRAQRIRDAWLVRAELADGVRGVMEIDKSTRTITEEWETYGHPLLNPGDVVDVISPSTNPDYATDYKRWLISIDQQINDQGYIANMSSWAGNGSALQTATDCTAITIGGGATYHLGDQVRSNFDVPNPIDVQTTIPFTVPNVYTSMTLRGYVHSSNSAPLNNTTNPPRDLSRIEVWQSGVRISSVNLPVLDDNVVYDWTSPPTIWQRLIVPFTGTLVAGAAEIRIIAGEDIDPEVYGNKPYDDFEVTSMVLTACGIGIPVLP